MQRQGLVLSTIAGAALALSAAPASAATSAVFSCRGSAVELQVAQNSRVAPIVANQSPCTDTKTGVPNVGEAVGLAQLIRARTAYASTMREPDGAVPMAQTVGSDAGVEGLEIDLAPGLKLGVEGAISSARAACVDGAPVLGATSTVLGLKVNGQEAKADALLSGILDPVSNSPLGQVVQVRLNEEVKTATGIIRRAAHVIVLDGVGGMGTPLVDVVIAESRVNSDNACDPKATENLPVSGSGTDGAGNGGLPQVCPTGSSLDRDRGLCVILAANTAGQGLTVVGTPFSGPSGGRVVALDRAREQFKSPCLQGAGPRFVTVGTNGRDRITGTNRADRILGRGGNDAIDGGRENDCIDGGTGGDNLSGALGNDRVFGMSGKDHLNGGSGTDRLSAGSGNDSINAAFGQDQVFGGSGRDFINVATAGKPARVSCGSGTDKVRVNANERNRTTGCEVRYVFKDR